MRTPVIALLLPLLSGGLIRPHPSEARTWNIYLDGSGDAPTIQAGVDSAVAGDTVLVHDGTYTGPGNKDVEVVGKNLVVRSVSGPGATVIDCEGAGRGFDLQSDTSVDGFTIRNGYTRYGGGIRADICSPFIRNCVFEGNTAIDPRGGGGVYVYKGWIKIRHCEFRGNSGSGGGRSP